MKDEQDLEESNDIADTEEQKCDLSVLNWAHGASFVKKNQGMIDFKIQIKNSEFQNEYPAYSKWFG